MNETNEYHTEPAANHETGGVDGVPTAQPVNTLTREVIGSTMRSFLATENLRWLFLLFLFVNTGLFGVHRILTKRYLTGILMMLGSCLAVAYIVMPNDPEATLYEVIKIGAAGGALMVLGFYLVDLYMILAGTFSAKDGIRFQRQLPRGMLFGLGIVVILNIEIWVALFL